MDREQSPTDHRPDPAREALAGDPTPPPGAGGRPDKEAPAAEPTGGGPANPETDPVEKDAPTPGWESPIFPTPKK